MDDGIKLIQGSISKIEVKPTERLIIKFDEYLTDDEYKRVVMNVSKWAGGIPILILDKSASVDIVSVVEDTKQYLM